MATQEVALQEKKELAPAQERTEAGKFYSPYTDIYETDDTVIVAMEVPGVDKSATPVLARDRVVFASHDDGGDATSAHLLERRVPHHLPQDLHVPAHPAAGCRGIDRMHGDNRVASPESAIDETRRDLVSLRVEFAIRAGL